MTASVNMTGSKKARHEAGLFHRADRINRSDDVAVLLRELGDLRGEARDFAAGVVLVNDVALGGAHQSRLGIRQRLHRGGAIAGCDGLFDIAHSAAHLGAARLVDGSAAGDLARRLLGGGGIGHGLNILCGTGRVLVG